LWSTHIYTYLYCKFTNLNKDTLEIHKAYVVIICIDIVLAMNTAKVREYQRTIQKWQSREADNIGYRRRNKTKQKHNTMYVGHHYFFDLRIAITLWYISPVEYECSSLLLNIREYQRTIQKWQSREADNLGYTGRNKTEQKLIHSFWNALRIRRKINQLHESSCYTSSIYYTKQSLNLPIEIKVLVLDRHKIVAALNRLMGSQLSPHDKGISNDSKYITKL
jgi:hypothetical protein